ncbi:hypothetical protein [Fictibacillus barbaricus]|uniref:Uncharacterized protein n=1 Tax=Fictibacillus barbaricus TaxID=182136 RepID=A0ABU1TY13_9BACL|nr:hypothetical protein [Fictibacillus barbaricus]MDR7072058.1 hypothetical protein [Fictibacillus barbaricus]
MLELLLMLELLELEDSDLQKPQELLELEDSHIQKPKQLEMLELEDSLCFIFTFLFFVFLF